MHGPIVRAGMAAALVACLSACMRAEEADDVPDGSSADTDTDPDGDADADAQADTDTDADSETEAGTDPSLDPCEGYDDECMIETAIEYVPVDGECGIDVEAIWAPPEEMPFDPCLVNVYLRCESGEMPVTDHLPNVDDCCWGDAWSWAGPGLLVLCEDACGTLADPACSIELDFGCKSAFNACESPPL